MSADWRKRIELADYLTDLGYRIWKASTDYVAEQQAAEEAVADVDYDELFADGEIDPESGELEIEL